MHRLALTILILTLPASLEAFEVGRVIEARRGARLDALFEVATEPLGLAPLLQLDEDATWFPYATLTDDLRVLAENERSDPLVRALATQRLAVALAAGGDLADAEAYLDAAGFLTSWSLIGPFPNDGMAGYDAVYPPEASRDPDGSYTGRVGPVTWRDVSEWTRLAYVDVADFVRPAHSAVSYAATTVDVPRRTRARLWTSVDGAYRVWVNGEQVAALDESLGAEPVREWWDVELDRGSNEIVVKVAVETGPAGFYLRLTDRRGNAISGLESSGALDLDVGQLVVDGVPEATGTVIETLRQALLGERVREAASPTALASAAYIVRRLHSRDASEPWRDFLTAGAPCESDQNAALQLCAATQDQYWQRFQYLERAFGSLTAESGLEWLWSGHALAVEMMRSVGEAGRTGALRLVESLLEVEPEFVPALLLQARIFENADLALTATTLIDRAADLAPHSPEVLYQLQWAAQRVDATQRLIDVYIEQAAVERDKHGAMLSLISAYLRAGRDDDAMQVFRIAFEYYPASLPLYWSMAQHLENVGDSSSARTVHEDAVALVPGDALAWESYARFLMRIGAESDARDAMRTALSIEPQNSDLAGYLRHIDAAGELFYADYLVDLDALRALQEIPPHRAERYEGRDYHYLLEQDVIRVYDNGLGSRFRQVAVQVNTRNGAEARRSFAIQYTPDEQVIRVLRARIIKPDGTVLESHEVFEDDLSQPWYGLYYDLRSRVLVFEDLEPGDVLEIAYTLSDITSRNIFDDYFGDLWFLQDEQPKRLARYAIVHSPEQELAINLPDRERVESTEIRETEEGSAEHLVYAWSDVPRVETEDRMPGYSSVADYVHVSTFATWSDVGDWYWNLIEDQLVASPEIEATVSELTQGLASTRERVAAIHEYVVRNTRYVGLEFGIHGFKPYRTTVSFSRRFGDCKDTASLMHVMLGVAGIDSRIVLVRTHDLGEIDETPASLSVFNHAITYVPELDMYMDGTAGFSGLDELPRGNQGASVLIVEPDGGSRFTQIPISPPATNRREVVTTVDLTRPGAPSTQDSLNLGHFAPIMRQTYESSDAAPERFQRNFSARYPGAVVRETEFTGLEDITQPVRVVTHFSQFEWIRETDSGVQLLPLGATSDFAVRHAGPAERRQALIEHPFQLYHSVQYMLPDDVTPLIEEGERVIESEFGRLSFSLQHHDAGLMVEMLLQSDATEVPVASYPAFREFWQSVDRTLNESIRLEVSR